MKKNILFIFAFSLISFIISSCASGTALVTGVQRPSTSPESVVIYTEPPVNYEVIGIVTASSDSGWTDQGSLEYALKEIKKQADSSLRDTENVPLQEDITEYFNREVLPFAQDAWIEEKKSVVGYEIPFTRYFYKYQAPKPSSQIMDEIKELEKNLMANLSEIMGE